MTFLKPGTLWKASSIPQKQPAPKVTNSLGPIVVLRDQKISSVVKTTIICIGTCCSY